MLYIFIFESIDEQLIKTMYSKYFSSTPKKTTETKTSTSTMTLLTESTTRTVTQTKSTRSYTLTPKTETEDYSDF